MSCTTNFFNQEEEKMKKGLLPFEIDPEKDTTYFTIYKDNQLIGHSNREAALKRFLLNVKLAPKAETENLMIAWDDEPDKKYKITSEGFIENGYSGHLQLASEYTQRILRVFHA